MPTVAEDRHAQLVEKVTDRLDRSLSGSEGFHPEERQATAALVTAYAYALAVLTAPPVWQTLR